MAIIKGFLSTNVWKAFLMNGIATSFAIIGAIFLKDFWDRKNNKHHIGISARQMGLTFAISFAAIFLAYTALHFLFGFGGGMLVIT